jgi:hypothetical protein
MVGLLPLVALSTCLVLLGCASPSKWELILSSSSANLMDIMLPYFGNNTSSTVMDARMLDAPFPHGYSGVALQSFPPFSAAYSPLLGKTPLHYSFTDYHANGHRLRTAHSPGVGPPVTFTIDGILSPGSRHPASPPSPPGGSHQDKSGSGKSVEHYTMYAIYGVYSMYGIFVGHGNLSCLYTIKTAVGVNKYSTKSLSTLNYRVSHSHTLCLKVECLGFINL